MTNILILFISIIILILHIKILSNRFSLFRKIYVNLNYFLICYPWFTTIISILIITVFKGIDTIVYAAESDDVAGYGRWSKSEQIFLPAKSYKDIDINLTQETWDSNDTIRNRVQTELNKTPSQEELKKIETHLRQVVVNYLKTLEAQQAQSVQPMDSIQPAQSSPTLSLFSDKVKVDDFITQMKEHFHSNPYDSEIFKAEIGTLIHDFSQTLYNQGVGESLQLVIDKLPKEALSHDVDTKDQVRSEFVEYVRQHFSVGSSEYKYYVASFRAVLYVYNQMIIMPDTLEEADELRIFNERLQIELAI